MRISVGLTEPVTADEHEVLWMKMTTHGITKRIPNAFERVWTRFGLHSVEKSVYMHYKMQMWSYTSFHEVIYLYDDYLQGNLPIIGLAYQNEGR